jgi:hypothetical protein
MWDEQEAAEAPARRRTLEVAPISGWTSVQIHVPSSRQLPTDHDHGGGYRPIPEYQSDQSSAFALGRFLVVPRLLQPPVAFARLRCQGFPRSARRCAALTPASLRPRSSI